MSALKLPAGWKVEMLGLANVVQFTSPSGSCLMWGDGRWTFGKGSVHMPASAVPHAATMQQARTVGTAWIVECEG